MVNIFSVSFVIRLVFIDQSVPILKVFICMKETGQAVLLMVVVLL